MTEVHHYWWFEIWLHNKATCHNNLNFAQTRRVLRKSCHFVAETPSKSLLGTDDNSVVFTPPSILKDTLSGAANHR